MDWVLLAFFAWLMGIFTIAVCIILGVGYICENGIQSVVEVIWTGSK